MARLLKSARSLNFLIFEFLIRKSSRSKSSPNEVNGEISKILSIAFTFVRTLLSPSFS